MTPQASVDSTTDRVRHPLAVRRLAVVRTEPVGRTLRRVVLGGPELASFASVGITDHVKLFVPTAAGGAPTMPVVVDGEWVDRRDPALTYREITVRTYVPDAGELALEVVTGEHGPTSRWAAHAAPGQEVGVLGPKTSVLRPLDRGRYVLAVDETGLPALRNWLDRLPASAQVTALVQVGRRGDEVPLPTRSNLEVTWLYRSPDDVADARGPGLADAVEALLREGVAAASSGIGMELGARAESDAGTATAVGGESDAGAATGVSTPSAFWWVAAEAGQVARIRSAVVAAGIDRRSWAMTAYWRRGVAHFDHKAPDA